MTEVRKFEDGYFVRHMEGDPLLLLGEAANTMISTVLINAMAAGVDPDLGVKSATIHLAVSLVVAALRHPEWAMGIQQRAATITEPGFYDESADFLVEESPVSIVHEEDDECEPT